MRAAHPRARPGDEGASGRTGGRNRVLLVLVVLGLIGLGALGFVNFAPNRLLSGRPVLFWAAVSPAAASLFVAGWLALALLAVLPASRAMAGSALALGVLLALATVAAAGAAATSLAAGAATPFARTSLGAGFWLMLFAAALVAMDALQRLGTGGPARAGVVLVAAAALAAMAHAGLFDDLSLAKEYANRREIFASELMRHVVLVATAVCLAIVIGVPLGLLARRRPRAGGTIFAALNLLQTIPSIALFGLLIGPLSWLSETAPVLQDLGVRGIGATPAIVALTLYSLLPVARNTHAGLGSVRPSVVESARGMGLTRGQILRQVELPIAWPVLLSGLRIVTVQAIGLAVVAALIGAGGLGTFVFQGLGQNALDLVLLGALTTILLALAADFMFQLLLGLARRDA